MFDVGDTVIEFPLPIEVPPHEPAYHSAVAPVPAAPPDSVNVVDSPLHIVDVPVILVGAELLEFTVTDDVLADSSPQELVAVRV